MRTLLRQQCPCAPKTLLEPRYDGAQGEPGTADFFGLGEPGDALAQMLGDVQRLFSLGAGSLFERHMAEQMQRLFEPGRVGGWDRCLRHPCI